MQFGFRDMICTSILLGMAAGTYGMIVQPHARARRRQLAEIRSMDAALSEIHSSSDGFDALAQRVDQQQQQATLFASRLPGESEKQKAIDELLQTAAANSLQAGEVLLLKSAQNNGVIAQPIKLQFTGNFNGFYSFLLQLEGMPRVTRMTQLSLRGGDDHDGQVQADMTLTVYLALPYNHALAADALPPESGQAAAARQVIDNYLSTGQRQFDQLQGVLHGTDKLMQQCLADRAPTQIPLAALRNNPFRLNTLPASNVPDAVAEQKSDTARLAMLEDLKKLQLQSVVASGEQPECIINTHLYHEGEQVDNFTIERIAADIVVVTNGGYRFELKIAS